MSLHPTLKSSSSKKHKSVLKRLEKIFRLQKDGRWKEEDAVLGLPKVKVIRIKIKKEKAKPAEGAEAAAGAAPEAAAAGQEAKPAGKGQQAAPQAKPQAKPEAGKKQPEKK